MFYVGLDVHKKRSTYVVLDENGKKVKSRTVLGPWRRVLQELARIPKPHAVCFEASTGYGYLGEQLRKSAQRVVVAHPGKLRLIFRSKRKSDRVDAEKLAKLLFLDEVPAVHVPEADVRAWRAMIEHRRRLVSERTRSKNVLRALLRGQGIETPKGLWTKAGVEWLRRVSFEQELDALQRDMAVERLTSLSCMIKRAEQVLDQRGQAHPGVQLLLTIPGVGPRTAEAFVASVNDPRRFPRKKAIGSYFGLVPCEDSSGGKNRYGHITREGPSAVRQFVTEAAWQGIRHSSRIRAYYERIRRDDPERKKIAIVATAHYLVRVMLAMLQTGEAWRREAAAS